MRTVIRPDKPFRKPSRRGSKLAGSLLVAGIMLAPAVSIAQSTTGSTSPTIEPPPMARDKSTLSSADATFLRQAIQADTTEISASQAALQKSQNPAVKSFAQKMITDHDRTRSELSTLARQKGLTVPVDASAVERAKVKAISLLSGDLFDKEYVRSIGVSAHEDAVKLFTDTSNSAQDADVKAIAARILPTLEGHLKMARDLKSQIDGNKSD